MGKIQQAFNQALNIGAIAVGPAIAAKKQAKANIELEAKKAAAEEKRITDLETEAEEAENYRTQLAEKEPRVEDAILDEALQRSYEAQAISFNARPTAKKLEFLGVLRGEMEENKAYDAAKKAASSVAKSREQYGDQTAAIMIDTLKRSLNKGGAK